MIAAAWTIKSILFFFKISSQRTGTVISKKSSMTVKIGKKAFYKQVDMTLSEAYDYASKVMVDNMLKVDAEEGIDAFIEKRNPNWQDK